MEIFNVGFGELFFILLIALILLGPLEMTKAARGLGKFLRQVIRSPMWHDVVETSRQLRDLPNKIIREANVEDSLEELKQAAGEIQGELQGEVQQINAESRSISAEVRQLRVDTPIVLEENTPAPDSAPTEKPETGSVVPPVAPEESAPALEPAPTREKKDDSAEPSPDST